MKIRRSVLSIIVVCAVLLALTLWFLKKPTDSALLQTSNADTGPLSAEVANSEPKQPGGVSGVSPAEAGNNTAETTPRSMPQTKGEQMKEGLAALNDEEVVLYGKVIDQFGAPVTDAEILGTIQINDGSRVGTDRMSVRTDSEGVFTISGYKGKNLGIFPKKSGYILASSNTSFVYSHLWPEAERYTPDPKRPAIITMWKLQGSEPLAEINAHFKVPYTSAPIYFDLLTGSAVNFGGDIKITVSRPDGIISQQNPQKWSLNLEIVDGGFIATTTRESRITYSAPESGYLKSQNFSNNNGPDLVEQVFFIKSRGGQIFSKLQCTFRINNAPEDSMLFIIKGVANTNSSRNWEATAPQ